MGQSLRERLKCEADVPEAAIQHLLQLYHQRARWQSMDGFIATIKRVKG